MLSYMTIQMMWITNAIKDAKNALVREGTRANQKYALKANTRIIASRNMTVSLRAFSSGVRFAMGTGVSNGLNQLIQKTKLKTRYELW